MARPYDENHVLELSKDKISPMRINGVHYQGGFKRSFEDYRCAFMEQPDVNTSVVLEPPLWEYWVTEALANVNIHRTEVPLPLFLYELKDLPRLFETIVSIKRRGGDSIPDSHLSYEFGIRPFLADLKAFLGLGKIIEDRLNYLRDLREGKTIKRSLHYSVSDPAGYWNWTTGYFPRRYWYTITDTKRVWFSVVPRQVGEIPYYESPIEAMYKVLGIKGNITWEDLWNGVPWSWFIDWFSNVGTLIATHGNGVDYLFTDLCVMQYQSKVTEVTKVEGHPSGLTVTGGHRLQELKLRHPSAFPSPTIMVVPMFGLRQFAILGSLSISKLGFKS
jgi:hypothetical protein